MHIVLEKFLLNAAWSRSTQYNCYVVTRTEIMMNYTSHEDRSLQGNFYLETPVELRRICTTLH